MKWLWLRHTWTFNWAHKPLCDRFQEDVVRIGRACVCRSCLLLYTGIIAGIVLLLVVERPLPRPVVFAGVMLTALTVVLSAPLWYKKWPRRVRDVLRFSSGAAISFCLGLPFTGHVATGMIGVVLLVAFWMVCFRLRGSRKRQACDGCEQLRSRQICAGFAYQAQHIRRYEQAATEYLLAQGGNPLPVRELTDKE